MPCCNKNKEKYLELLCFPTSSATPFLRGTFTFRLKVPKPSLQGQEREACSFLLLGSRWKLRPANPPLATESERPGGVLTPGRSQAGLPSARRLRFPMNGLQKGEKSREQVPQSRGPRAGGPGGRCCGKNEAYYARRRGGGEVSSGANG